jgi:Cu2+-exporting ATPase
MKDKNNQMSDHHHNDQRHMASMNNNMLMDETHEHQHMMPEDHSMHTGHEGHKDHEPSGGSKPHADHTGHEQMFKKLFWLNTLLSIPVLLYSPSIQNWLGFKMTVFTGSIWITPIFALAVFYFGGIPFIKMAVPELKDRRPGMMTLISLAISVALIYSIASLFIPTGDSFFWELVTLIDIMLLGHWIEMRSIRQASGAMNELAKLMPDTAEQIQSDGTVKQIETSALKKGDLILVRPGASVAADGLVEEGISDVNESMITGESKPIKKVVGASVIAGTINGDGSLHVRVTAIGDETALAGIMRLVEQAQQSKSKTQILADKAAGWLFYVAIAVAILTAIAWTISTGFNVEVISRVATVLVIACPHALGLAVPLVVSITTALGAKNGILVRDRIALEKAREIDIVVFDKTGTLTRGEFGVVDMAAINNWEVDKALAIAAAIEGDSEHTIARGIRSSANGKKLTLPYVSNFEAIKGRGVKAEINQQSYYVGGPRLLEMLNLVMPQEIKTLTDKADSKGQSIVYLVQDQQLVAGFVLSDVVRPESKKTIEKLHTMGVEIAMLTGDSQAVAKTVAEEIGIDQYFAEVLPEDKDKKVMELQAQGKRVAMVGDGVNDAPALTRADVGIAIGGGTDVAIESAGIILVRSDPLDVVNIFTLSRASYRKMIQNLWWAAGYNVITLPLAAGVLAHWGILLSPAVGAVLMSLSTVIVAINAQLMRNTKFSL